MVRNEKALACNRNLDRSAIMTDVSALQVRGLTKRFDRPAVDALFRSASWAYGPRVIGVILSGYQDCGTAGMMSIKARGGLAVVQSPESAQVSEMIRSVIASVEVEALEAASQVVTPASPDTPRQAAARTEKGVPVASGQTVKITRIVGTQFYVTSV